MQHRFPWFQTIAALLLIVAWGVVASGCSTTPQLDTTNKRVYATELAVEGMLAQIDQYEQEGRFTDEQWDEIVSMLEKLRAAHLAMELDLAEGIDPGANIATVHAILVALRPYVEDSP